jgi:hypothetical protein
MRYHSLLVAAMLLPLTTIFADSMQEHKMSGSLSFDIRAPFQPSDTSNTIYLSGAQLKFKGPIIEKWSYDVAFKHPSYAIISPKNNDESTKLKYAIAQYAFMPDATLSIGKTSPRFSQASSPSNCYIERDIGVLDEKIGDQIGLKVEGLYRDKYGDSLGVWKATARPKVDLFFYSGLFQEDEDDEESVLSAESVTFDGSGDLDKVTLAAKLKIALGGRLNAVLHNAPDFMWGAGIGGQTIGVITPMIAEYDTGSSNEPRSTFENRYALTIDQSIGTKRAVLNIGLQHFGYQRESSAKESTPVSSIAAGVNVFQAQNMANSAYVEMTYLIIGERYEMNKKYGVISDIVPSQTHGSLELAARAGSEWYYNAASAEYLGSAYNTNNAVPFEVIKGSGYNNVVINPALMTSQTGGGNFCIKAPGYSIHLNYAPDKNITYIAEYYHQKVIAVGQTSNTTLETREGLRLRSEYSF